MKVKEVMIKKVKTIKSGQTLEQAAKILVKNNISGAPVVDKNGKLIGMISEKDLFKTLYPDVSDILSHLAFWLNKEKIKYRVASKKQILVDKIMTKKVVTIDENDHILKAGSLMLTSQIHRLPVMRDKKLVGIVSRRDIFRKLLKRDLSF